MLWCGLLAGAVAVSASVHGGADPTCAWAESLERSFERLDTVSSTVALTVDVDVRAERVDLRLSKSGRVLLERQLPAGGACEARIDGVVLVVEQQLRDLGYVAPLEPPTPPPAPPGPPDAPDQVDAGEPAPEPDADASESEPQADVDANEPALGTDDAWRLWVGLAGAVEAPGSVTPRGGGRLDIRAERRWLSMLLVLSGLSPQSVDVRPGDPLRGELTYWVLRLTFGAEACWATGVGRVCGGLRSGLRARPGDLGGDPSVSDRGTGPLRRGHRRRRSISLRFCRQLGRYGSLLKASLAPCRSLFRSKAARPSRIPHGRLRVPVGVSVAFF